MTASRLILALDRSQASAQVLRVGAALARSVGAEIGLVAVVNPRLAGSVDGGFPDGAVLAGLRREAQSVLDEAERALGASAPVTKHLREGEPGAQICQCAAEWGAGYIALGLNSWDAPSSDGMRIAEAVVRGAGCPVLVVPPPAEPEGSPEPAESTAAPAGPAEADLAGLTQRQADALLGSHGPNEVATPARNPLTSFLLRFWGAVPGTLELALIAILLVGRWRQAAIIALFLVLNAVVGAYYEGRAVAALRSLRKRLVVTARVRRDGAWTTRPAREVVPGDVCRLRSGDVVPADLWLLEGTVLLDYSTLTGEAQPVEVGAGAAAHAGTVVRRGEATGRVTATAERTVFATSATEDDEARAPGRLQALMLHLVRLLALLALASALLVMLAAPLTGVPWTDAISFAIALLIVAMPVSLPVMVTLTGALGARDLASRGILLTRLSAIQNAAAMDLLCVDKTGTLTSNDISVERVVCAGGASEQDVLLAAAAASATATLDPLDVATLRAAHAAGLDPARGTQRGFVPFDPNTQLCEGVLTLDGRTVRGVKGAPRAVAGLIGELDAAGSDLVGHVDRLGATGGRVLAVAIAEPPEGPPRLAGLMLLADPPRPDSLAMVEGLRAVGVRVVMVTGDGLATASSVARAVGIGQRGRLAEGDAAPGPMQLDCDIHAGVQPADKLSLIRGLQNIGHAVGMTGDGVNDARALRQADVGIAVAGATDVARAAAGVVLTEPGLIEVVEAVRIGRTIQQRLINYVLSMISRKAIIMGFLAAVLAVTALPAVHAGQVLLLVLVNVFLTLSLATDRVTPSPTPDHWNTRSLATVSLAVAGLWIGLLLALYLAARRWLGLSDSELHTLAFVLLALAGQWAVFNVRARGWLWSSRPSALVLGMSVLGAAAAMALAIGGVLMAPLRPMIVLGLVPVMLAGMVLVDIAKNLLLRREEESLS
jgi:H+-transporting ATPase